MSEPDIPMVENFRPLCTVADLKPGEDTIYIRKNQNGVSLTCFCVFKGFSRGMVEAEVVWINPPWAFAPNRDKGRTIRARIDSCYLWGVNKDAGQRFDRNPRCQWFTTVAQPAGGF